MKTQTFMAACREGAARLEAALLALEREVGPSLHRWCCAAGVDPHRACDVVQDTLIKVWLRCSTFRGEADLIHWIKSILRREILDLLTRTRIDSPTEDEQGDLLPNVEKRIAAMSMAAGTDPEWLLHRKDLETSWRRCFDRFQADAPVHAAVMRWVVEDGLDNAQVAELLQRSPGATRQFTTQVRKKIRIYFAEWYGLVSSSPAKPGLEVEHG